MLVATHHSLRRLCHFASSLFECSAAGLLRFDAQHWELVDAGASFPELDASVVEALNHALQNPDDPSTDWRLHRIPPSTTETSSAKTPNIFLALSTPLDRDSLDAFLEPFTTSARDLLNAQQAQTTAEATEALDTVERQEREALIAELRRSNEHLEQFAYIASHDLQEPLRMVTGFMDLLQDEYADHLDDDANDYINYAVDGARRMKEMIHGLLTYARTWSSDEEVTTVHTAEMVAQICDELLSNHPEKEASITVDPLPDVQARPSQLRRLFSNLVVNAMTHGGATPTIVITHEEQSEHHLIAITDAGPGVSLDQHERIFDLFVSGVDRSSDQSSGLGLAICRSVVEGHGGRLWIESPPEGGARFSFTLPKD